MTTHMWQEIHEQPAVARRLLQTWRMGRAALLAECQEELRRADRVVLAGTGASLAACRAGQYVFIRCGRLLPHVMPADDLAGPASRLLGPESLVILASQSGESLETREAVRALRPRGVRMWGLTNDPASLLAREADRMLLLEAGAEVSSATKTYLATVLLLMLLAGAGRCLECVPDDLEETLRRSAGPVAGWVAELAPAQAGYILGLQNLAPIAAQGALLLKEKTFLHFEGLSVAEFRHGCIEVVRPGLPILLLATTPDGTAEALRHAAYLSSLGADVRLITDADPPGGADALPPGRVLRVQNRGDRVLAMLQAVVPLQLLAEGIARQLGRDVDGFRHTSKVVDTYRF